MASNEHKVSFSFSLSIDNSLVRDSHKASRRFISRLIFISDEELDEDEEEDFVVRFEIELDAGDERTMPFAVPVDMLSKAAMLFEWSLVGIRLVLFDDDGC